jgi:hypothetical protein
MQMQAPGAARFVALSAVSSSCQRQRGTDADSNSKLKATLIIPCDHELIGAGAQAISTFTQATEC